MDDELEVLKVAIAIEGVVACVLCFGLFVFFIRSRYQIGRAVGLDKLAEGLLATATLVFTLFVGGVWDLGFSDFTIVMIRASMFGISIGCSIHLAIATWQITKDHE